MPQIQSLLLHKQLQNNILTKKNTLRHDYSFFSEIIFYS